MYYHQVLLGFTNILQDTHDRKETKKMGPSLMKKRLKWPKKGRMAFIGVSRYYLGWGHASQPGKSPLFLFLSLPSDTLQVSIEAPSFAGQFLAARYAQHHQG